MAEKKQDQPISQPDPGTKHTTDPEDHMEGPISSLMQNIKEGAENEDVKKKGDDDNNKRS